MFAADGWHDTKAFWPLQRLQHAALGKMISIFPFRDTFQVIKWTVTYNGDAFRQDAPAERWEEEMSETTVNVRYMVDDVEAAITWYTTHLGFSVLSNYAPAFADVRRGALRLLLSGPTSSAARPMPDGAQPRSGGWNRIHLIVDDLPAEAARLRTAGVQFRNDIVTGPGGSQILLIDPSGNFVELFQPALRLERPQ